MAGGNSSRTNWTGWAFVAPALTLLGLFMVYPIFWSLWMSFQTGKGLNFKFGGVANFVRLTLAIASRAFSRAGPRASRPLATSGNMTFSVTVFQGSS